jgi:DNA-binding MarR family transcriptional regulator
MRPGEGQAADKGDGTASRLDPTGAGQFPLEIRQRGTGVNPAHRACPLTYQPDGCIYSPLVKPKRASGRTGRSVRAKAAIIAEACIAVRLRILTRRVTSIYDRELRPHGLTIGQMNILVMAFRRAPVTQQDLGQALHLEKSTLSRDLARMCAQGWVSKARGDDGRATILRVTPTGQRLLEKAFPAWREAQRKTRPLLGEGGVASLRRLADPGRAARAPGPN